MKLFEMASASVELDIEGATKFKAEHEATIAAMEAEVAALTGKDNKKARTEKSKEVSNVKNMAEYIDACKVVKGLEPKNGHFMKKKEVAPPPAAKKAEKKDDAPKEEKEEKEKKEKPKKAAESTGISKEERDELENLKKQIIERKAQLKAEGMSGGQQNKDAQVAAWVARMNELKEKEFPGSTQKGGKDDDKKKKKKGALSSEEQKEYDALKQEVEAYRQKLVSEFGYSKKDIKADPEMGELEAKLAAFEKRSS